MVKIAAASPPPPNQPLVENANSVNRKVMFIIDDKVVPVDQPAQITSNSFDQ